jgi:alpha-mannosidase
MLRNASAIRSRLDRAMLSRVRGAEYGETGSVAVTCRPLAGEPVAFTKAIAGEFSPIDPGTSWGPSWSTLWLHLVGEVPKAWRGRRVELLVEVGFSEQGVGFQAEGLAFDADGAPIKGINPRSRWVPVADAAVGGDLVDVYVEAASNPVILPYHHGAWRFDPTPEGDRATAAVAPQYVLGESRLVVVNEEVRALISELDVLSELSDELPAESSRRWEILVGIDRALDVLDARGVVEGATGAREVLAPLLARPAEASAHTLSAIGHAHIDSAWLWPFRETRRKVARTVANVLHLMDIDPDLIYAMSTAQQYAWLKEDQPELFERLRQRVAEGRFIPVGGMWVESDTNMPSGEAMVRQFLYGTRFFEREFGVATSIGWLPDSFGYSAAMPQIMKRAGIVRFITQKISWNSTNRFPHHTFWWEGIDGSRVFTHFPSADMYNSQLLGRELAHAGSNFEEKGWSNRSLIPFGFGDGGGGPTREMMARARLTTDLEGSPRVHIESPAHYFDAAEADLPNAAVWFGEMYLEFHRGVLTSQARTKQGNRRSERMLREAELWATTASVRAGAEYPHNELESAWETVLLLQFHDVLPGSSIAWVYQDAEAEYQRVESLLESIITGSLAAIVATEGAVASGQTLVANASPFTRRGVAGHSVGHPDVETGAVLHTAETSGAVTIANEFVSVRIADDGTVASIVDHASGREVVQEGARANLLQLHPDHPTQWDAWDLDEPYSRTVEDVTALDERDLVELENGGVRFTVRRRFGESEVLQSLTLLPNSRTIEFEVDVDWHEKERILKVAMPTTISTERWAAETQFGHLFRSTHSNTSWEAAKFEACAHRWVHVGEPDFGVAVTNEHTYGHEVRRTGSGGRSGTLIRLSLLRAPLYPDPAADQGRHILRYSVVVGATIGDAVEAGYAAADAERSVLGTQSSALVTSSHPAVVIDTIKLAEDRSGDVIVRLYESRGGYASSQITLGFVHRKSSEVNLLEGGAAEVAGTGDSIALQFAPFEVKTLRIGRP